MRNREGLTRDLLVSISGVMLFLSLSYWIDLNGYSSFAPLFLIAGVLILFWSDNAITAPHFLKYLRNSTLQTLSHILIFVGLEVYFYEYIGQYWFIFMIIAVLLLNNSRRLSKLLAGKG